MKAGNVLIAIVMLVGIIFFGLSYINKPKLTLEDNILNMGKEKLGEVKETINRIDINKTIKESKEDYFPIIIEFNDDPLIKFNSEDEKIKQKEKIMKIHNELSSSLSKESKITNEWYQLINGMSINITKEDLKKLEGNNYIKDIWVDGKIKIQMNDVITLTNAIDVWKMLNLSNANITGTGIKVAILDTGIAYDHVDFGNCSTENMTTGNCSRIPYGWDFVNGDNDPYDDASNSHGTLIAGIIGANGSLKGIAPNVSLLIYKVLDSGGSGEDSNIISAIENATINGASIISMSFGGDGYSDSVLSSAIENSMNAGTLTIASAGNGGSGFTYSNVRHPAADLNALAVGSIDKEEIPAYYSGKGFGKWTNGSISSIKPDLIIYGESINSTKNTGGYGGFSGTSAAAPVMAGLAALLFQARDVTPNEAKAILSNTATDLGYNPNIQGSGKPNILYAINVSSFVQPANFIIMNKTNETLIILNITNNYNQSLNYTISFNDSNNFNIITFSNQTIELDINESGNITVNVTLYYPNITASGFYYGAIIINTSIGEILRIPFGEYIDNNPDYCPSYKESIIANTTLAGSGTCFLPNILYGVSDEHAFTIEAPNLIFNCNGTSIIGIGKGPAVFINADNVTLKNCNISFYSEAISLNNANNVTIENSSIISNEKSINLNNNSNNHIINNNISILSDPHCLHSESCSGIFSENGMNNSLINITFTAESDPELNYTSSSYPFYFNNTTNNSIDRFNYTYGAFNYAYPYFFTNVDNTKMSRIFQYNSIKPNIQAMIFSSTASGNVTINDSNLSFITCNTDDINLSLYNVTTQYNPLPFCSKITQYWYLDLNISVNNTTAQLYNGTILIDEVNISDNIERLIVPSYNNYTLTISKNNYGNNTSVINMTTNNNLYILLDETPEEPSEEDVATTSCTTFERSIYSLIIGFSALMVLSPIIMLSYDILKKQKIKLSMILISFIIIIIGIVFVNASSNLLAQRCIT